MSAAAMLRVGRRRCPKQIAAKVTLPTGEYLEWGGQFENLVTARARLAIVVPICFAIILLLL